MLAYIATGAILWREEKNCSERRTDLINITTGYMYALWSTDGVVVRPFISHQCGPGAILAWGHM